MKKFTVCLILVLIVCAASCFILGGCAKSRDRWKAKGGVFTSSKSDYIVISQSGGLIMDVWKLKDVIVQSEPNSDGWLFLVNDNPVYIGGDVKTIRLAKDSSLWDKYHEYHMEFESQTYREKYNPEL